MASLARPLLAAALALSAFGAQAVDVVVTITGSVDYNVIRGDLTGIPSGAPVTMSFTVDSTQSVDNPQWPTRGYRIAPASFTLDIGGAQVTMDDPQPYADTWFVLRNDDPAVDGFFISQGSLDYPLPASVHVGGLAPEHELNFSRTFTGTHTLSSLDILDAQGSYGFEDMSSYMWTLGRFGSYGAEFVVEGIQIAAAVPEPGTLALLAGGLLVVARRAGRRA